MSEFNDPYARLDQLRGMFESTQSRVQEMQERIAALQVEAEDEDGRLKAVVGSSGVLALHIDPRAMRLGSEELAERLLALIRQATAEVQTAVQGISDELVAGLTKPDLSDGTFGG